MEELKYKENNIGYQFSRQDCSIFRNFIYDTPYCFAYISAVFLGHPVPIMCIINMGKGY